MSELIPNQKAATYIGWVYCANPDVFRPYDRLHCRCCGQMEWDNDPHQPAPDMNLPQNYMRALERFDEWHADSISRNEHWRVRRGLLEGAGDSALEALADYYDGKAELDDAEHEELKP